MITLVHFNLRDPIMVGKKKTGDVQFYTEVMESVQTLDTGRRSAYDPDELEEEQRERDMRAKVRPQGAGLRVPGWGKAGGGPGRQATGLW